MPVRGVEEARSSRADSVASGEVAGVDRLKLVQTRMLIFDILADVEGGWTETVWTVCESVSWRCVHEVEAENLRKGPGTTARQLRGRNSLEDTCPKGCKFACCADSMPKCVCVCVLEGTRAFSRCQHRLCVSQLFSSQGEHVKKNGSGVLRQEAWQVTKLQYAEGNDGSFSEYLLLMLTDMDK